MNDLDPAFWIGVIYPLVKGFIGAVALWSLWVSVMIWRGLGRLESIDFKLSAVPMLQEQLVRQENVMSEHRADDRASFAEVRQQLKDYIEFRDKIDEDRRRLGAA